MKLFYTLLRRIRWSSISVKNRLLAVFSFCFIISSITSILYNIYLGLPFEINIVVLIVMSIHIIAFYSSIRNKISDKWRFIYLTILVTFLPFAWVYNGGIIGSIPMYYFIYFTASILSLSYTYRNYFICYILLISLISLYIQSYHTELIVPYSSIQTQSFDMKFGFIQVIITTIMLTITYTRINDDMQLKLIRHKRRLETSYSRLAHAKQKADEAAKAKTNFITNISHEIRTPLTGIIGISDLLASSELSTEQRHLIHSLTLSSKTLLDLVNDLLDLSKIESNKLKLNNEVFNLRSTIAEIENLMTLYIRDKDITLKTIIKDGIPENILLDRTKYKQILINLLSNAIKFTLQGTVTCSIDFIEDSSTLQTTVEDTGIGIDSKDFDKLFTPFSQLNTTKYFEHHGVGMGLTISKKMAELMHGELNFKSTVNKGSCFIFTVPIQAVHTKSTQPTINHQEEIKHKKELRILIAEDHQINQMVLAKMIENLGHSHTVANNGQEAIDLAKENIYDAILMDIQMPIKNGIEASETILDHYQTIKQPSPSIIICSANVLQLKVNPQLKELLFGFLSKPINLEQLEAILNKLQ